jgi:hypothetical protein
MRRQANTRHDSILWSAALHNKRLKSGFKPPIPRARQFAIRESIEYGQTGISALEGVGMNIEDVMIAVADQLNIDESFFESPESQNHLLAILLRDRKLQALASRCSPHELGHSVELQVCIQRAAMELLCDLVRAEEVCSSTIARCGYHGELGVQPNF